MITTRIVNGAELKVTLGGLGLPPGWFAVRMNVAMRTVVRWFDSETVAPEVATELDKLCDTAINEMRKMLDKIPDTDSDAVTLTTFRTDAEVSREFRKWPASWHRALTFRVMEHLRAQGYEVSVEYR